MDVKILIVDDTRLNIKLLTDILVREGYTVYSVNNGSLVMEAVHRIRPDIILLDIVMPGLDGFEVLKLLKSDFELKDIPVIMVTSKTEGVDVKKALTLGAFDYIKKPLDDMEVIARVQSALQLKEYQEKLKEMAMKDGLTGLYNHSLLIELFDKELAKQRRKGNNICFVMADIDNFKKVNDAYGHMVGDVILKELSYILSESVRKSDIIGRYGGEEFGIILPEINSQDAYNLCERIRQNVENTTFVIEGHDIHVTISIGIYEKKTSDTVLYSEMVKKADEALYEAKRGGRNRIYVYKDSEAN